MAEMWVVFPSCIQGEEAALKEVSPCHLLSQEMKEQGGEAVIWRRFKRPNTAQVTLADFYLAVGVGYLFKLLSAGPGEVSDLLSLYSGMMQLLDCLEEKATIASSPFSKAKMPRNSFPALLNLLKKFFFRKADFQNVSENIGVRKPLSRMYCFLPMTLGLREGFASNRQDVLFPRI